MILYSIDCCQRICPGFSAQQSQKVYDTKNISTPFLYGFPEKSHHEGHGEIRDGRLYIDINTLFGYIKKGFLGEEIRSTTQFTRCSIEE